MIVITMYDNPIGYSTKRLNFNCFYNSITHQIGQDRLIVGEVVHENQKPSLSFVKNLIVFRTNSILWHRESVINEIVAQNKSDFVWVDCDIIFDNYKWLDKTEKMLSNFHIGQPFSIAEFLNSEMVAEKAWHSFCLGWNYGCLPELWYTTGYAWAMKYDIWRKCGGLPDYHILGGADMHFVAAATLQDPKIPYAEEEIKATNKLWNNAINGQIGVVPGKVKHMWHGNINNRQYNKRFNLLKNLGFKPKIHLTKNQNGLYEWSKNSDQLKKESELYFKRRNEDALSKLKIF